MNFFFCSVDFEHIVLLFNEMIYQFQFKYENSNKKTRNTHYSTTYINNGNRKHFSKKKNNTTLNLDTLYSSTITTITITPQLFRLIRHQIESRKNQFYLSHQYPNTT